MEILDLTIKELHEELVAKKISARELADFYLSRMKDYDGDIKSYLKVTEEEAKEMSDKADDTLRQAQGDSMLTGIPGSIKDVIVTKDVISTGGSRILENYIPPYDATVVKKLKEQDYVLLGKNNCDEFAQGSSNENSGFGPTKNPWDLSRVPGGSSGGSAASVAAGLAHFALGTDTGGSVRQPAALCSVVGLKPTYGRVSRYGLMAMASSLDQCGVFARRVDDVEQVLRVIEGEDALDATSSTRPSKFKAFDLAGSLKGIKVGVPKEYFTKGLDETVEKIVKDSISKLEELGAQIKEVSLPNFEYALATYYIIMPAEVSSNMARYEGIRYGKSVATLRQAQGDKEDVMVSLSNHDLEDLYKANRSKFLGDEVKRRIMLGTYVLSAGYYDEYYGKAQKVRQLIRQDFAKAFADVDVIAGPATPTPAFKLGEKTADPLAMYLSDIYTVPANLAGLPAISVPAGFITQRRSSKELAEFRGREKTLTQPDTTLPVGLHLIGNWWEDYKLFEVARLFEAATEIYKEKPSLNE
jgi:aspartyl-tRNA(Asn)/glutamyl-tRNA(Gln) amidotransferase subunit A